MELKILDNKGQAKGNAEFDDKLLESKASKAILHEVITAFRADQRAGTHFTKTRAEVSGGGIKPWKQKGTGRARSGSTRSPLWRHGGIIFGPRLKSYRTDMNKGKKKLAFKMAVREAITDNRLQVVEPIQISEPKTKLVAAVYKKWQAPTDSLYVVEKIDATFERAARNISNVELINAETLNVYHCLRARKIFITPTALNLVSTRIAKSLEN